MTQLLESRTWWLRLELSRQLPDFAALLSSQAVLATLAPLFLSLLADPVSSVREMTYRCALSFIHSALTLPTRSSAPRSTPIRSAACSSSTSSSRSLSPLSTRSAKWDLRPLSSQLFLLCCPSFVPLLSKASFKQLIRPVIGVLARDRVPAVRQMALELVLQEPGSRGERD